MSILTTFNRLAHTYRDIRRRARTERMISSLPLEVRKDIGWPHVRDAWDDRYDRIDARD